MQVAKRINYYRRILPAYLGNRRSQLSFWHDVPTEEPAASVNELGPYYMRFDIKANYQGPFDAAGIPLLDYRGVLGKQYNPIAIAQYGLGNFNLYLRNRAAVQRLRFINSAEWLSNNLSLNAAGILVWMHRFDWEYRETLRAPWYSGLAQGQGISMLLRAFRETGEERYLDSATLAFQAFTRGVSEGGVVYKELLGTWIEEYIVTPPTHILNGMIWAMWGIYDYHLVTKDAAAGRLFQDTADTLVRNLARFECWFWSRYELSGTALPMIASPFYHRLHCVQLDVLYKLTGEQVFQEYSRRWRDFQSSWWRRQLALGMKIAFKLVYY
jgi:heparosan-N-sulfate-glucuronate 5-epimerase